MKRRHVTFAALFASLPIHHHIHPKVMQAKPAEALLEPAPPAAPPAPPPLVPTTTTSTTQVAPPGVDLGDFEVTCYTLTGITATGTEVSVGTIAVDPSTIPLHSHLQVEGYGSGTALDTGGAIKGRHIDVWMASEAECLQWGVKLEDVKLIKT